MAGAHHSDIPWVLRWLNSLATQLFAQQLIEAEKKEDIKGLHYFLLQRCLSNFKAIKQV